MLLAPTRGTRDAAGNAAKAGFRRNISPFGTPRALPATASDGKETPLPPAEPPPAPARGPAVQTEGPASHPVTL